MAGRFKAAINRAIPWLLFGSVMIPAAGSAVVGLLVLVHWRQGGDIALGVLAISLGVAVLTGTIISLTLLRRQNTMVRAQAELVAHVGHELRTPLASIIMGIETLKEDRFDSETEKTEFLDMMEREAGRLARLVEQAIGYQVAATKAQRARRRDAPVGKAGQAGEAQCKVISAGAAVAEIMSTWLTRSDTKDFVRLENLSSDDDLLAVDPDDLNGALANMINNAMTHGMGSAERPVTVTVRARKTGSGARTTGKDAATTRDGWIEIDIADNGPGVAAGDRRRVFRKFQRGKSVSGNAVPGLGLGLSIVERFATTAGGRVELLDTPAPGATFRLTLPRHAENKEGRDA